MARQMKKALCIFLSVLMAFSCFAVGAFAYTGYDHNGSNNALRVQAVVTTDKTSYEVGDTVTATLTLNHIQDSVIGFQGYVAFDSSKLDFVSAAPAGDFVYYSNAMAPTPEKVTALDPAALTKSYGGSAFTKYTFANHIGAAEFDALAVANIAVQNLAGVAEGSDTAIATFTFEAKQAVSATNIAMVPSNVYSSTLGYLSCYATTSTEGVYTSAFAATRASGSFAITGGTPGDTYYDITFSWHGGSSVVNTKKGDTPVAPEVGGYSEGDYDYTFTGWSPAVAPASAATTYVAQYDSAFVSADYTAYNAAVAAATAKRDNGTNWTETSVTALNTELNKDVSGKGRTAQSEVDAQKDAIIAAAAALEEQAAVYEIKFVVKGETVSTQNVTAGDMPQVPSVNNYEDDAKTYTFTGWDSEVVAAAGNVTYTAQFSETWKEYDIQFSWNGGSQTVKTHWGDMPVAPTVPAYEDASAKYTFKEWSPALVACAGNAFYTAVYAEAAQTYTITFKYMTATGEKTDSAEVAYGVMPTAPNVASYNSADGSYTYTFKEWTPAVVSVTGAATYTATFTETANPADYSTVDAAIAEANSVTGAADYAAKYTKATRDALASAIDAVVRGKLVGEQSAVDAMATAINQAFANLALQSYNITFTWNGGSKTVATSYGATPEAPSVPSYEADGKTYSFARWNPAVVACAGEATYEAVYSSEYIIYSITFVIGDQSATQQVQAGSLPVVPEVDNYEDGDYDVFFTGWDKDVVVAAGDATYTAQFRRDFVEADYAAVDAAIVATQDVNRDIYTDESLAILDDALNAVVRGKGRTEQEQVEAFAQAITNAIGALEYKPADYTAYNEAVAALEIELAKEDYTPDSIESVRTQLNTIDGLLNKSLNILSQSTVDNATAAVAALSAQLVEKADKGELKSLIDQAKELDADKYVNFSAVTSELENAEIVYANDNATAKEVADAIRSLRNALSALVFKDADYSAWNALADQFAALELRYFQKDLVDNVKTVLAKVVKDQDINYQPALDDLTTELQAAIDALDVIKAWEGETDFYGVDHEYFYANLEFEKVSETNQDFAVNVYLNHPLDTVSGIQVAALFDANVVAFSSVEVNGGELVYANADEASFNPADYGYPALGKASVVKFAVDGLNLEPTYGGRDLIATLHFTPVNNGMVYLKAVPLASNVAPDGNTYSSFFDNNDAEHFMHSEYVTATFFGIISVSNIIADNAKAPIAIQLFSAASTEAVDSETFTPETDTQAAEDDVKFTDVDEGTYTMKLSAPGALTVTITNIVISADKPEFEVPQVALLYGDIIRNGVIDLQDVGEALTMLDEVAPEGYDTNGDGIVDLKDVGIMLQADHLDQEEKDQVISM